MTQQIFFCKKLKYISKIAKFHADFESVEEVVKKMHKKSYKQNKLANMSKSEKRHISVTFC
jgi:hypothetical protein